jgi:hypothetical protein
MKSPEIVQPLEHPLAGFHRPLVVPEKLWLRGCVGQLPIGAVWRSVGLSKGYLSTMASLNCCMRSSASFSEAIGPSASESVENKILQGYK